MAGALLAELPQPNRLRSASRAIARDVGVPVRDARFRGFADRSGRWVPSQRPRCCSVRRWRRGRRSPRSSTTRSPTMKPNLAQPGGGGGVLHQAGASSVHRARRRPGGYGSQGGSITPSSTRSASWWDSQTSKGRRLASAMNSAQRNRVVSAGAERTGVRNGHRRSNQSEMD